VKKEKEKRFRLDVEKIPSRGGYYFLLDPGDMVSVIVPVTSKELVVISAQGKALRWMWRVFQNVGFVQAELRL